MMKTITLLKKTPLYSGASPVAIKKLAEKKGYRLVGGNTNGINNIYIRNDVCKNLIPEIPVEQVLNHPSIAEAMKLFDKVKDQICSGLIFYFCICYKLKQITCMICIG